MATLISNSLAISTDLNLGEFDFSVKVLNHTDSLKPGLVFAKSATSIAGFLTADSFLGNGGNFNYKGQFSQNPYIISQMNFGLFSSESQVSTITYDGEIQIDTSTKVTSGFFSHIGLTYYTGEQADFFGKNDAHQHSRLNFDTVRFHTSDGQTLLLKGQLFLKSNFNQLFGTLSEIVYNDGQGHRTSLSGLSVDITGLSSTESLSDLVPQLMSNNDNENGTNASEVMYGFDGNDTLNGGNGADTLIGGSGNDTYIVGLNSSDQIQENADGGMDTVRINSNNSNKSAVNLNVSDFTNIESLKVTGNGLFNLHGDDNDNALSGNSSANLISADDGKDTLNGGGGSDTLSGGIGNDTYILVDNNSTINEKVDEGVDTVEIANSNLGLVITLQLSNFSNIENLTVTGNGLYQLIGTTGNNILKGNISANTINGNGGDDTLDGAAGNDIYYADSTSDVVAESQSGSTGGFDTVYASANFTLGENIEKLVLTGLANLNGTGNVSNNRILGNKGDNILDGGKGADILLGGKGHDTYYVDDAHDVIIDNDPDSIIFSTSLNYKLGNAFKNLTIIGSGDFNATGNLKNNLLIGNEGNNVLNGGAGHNTLIGGAGDDTYILDLNALDEVHETADGGSDTFWFINYTASTTPITLHLSDYQNIENLRVGGIGYYNLVGDDRNNVLTGNTYANLLEGGLGNDTLVSGGGKDTLQGGADDDVYVLTSRSVVVTEFANQGNDTLEINYDNLSTAINIQLSAYANFENIRVTGLGHFNLEGNAGANLLEANAGENLLLGLAGDDTLIGGEGQDTLEGGTGADHFVFTSTADSTLLHADQINDFDQTDLDKLDVSALDANALTSGQQGFNFIQGNAFTHNAGELRFESSVLSADTNGDGVADFQVHLLGVTSLSASDLILA